MAKSITAVSTMLYDDDSRAADEEEGESTVDSIVCFCLQPTNFLPKPAKGLSHTRPPSDHKQQPGRTYNAEGSASVFTARSIEKRRRVSTGYSTQVLYSVDPVYYREEVGSQPVLSLLSQHYRPESEPQSSLHCRSVAHTSSRTFLCRRSPVYSIFSCESRTW